MRYYSKHVWIFGLAALCAWLSSPQVAEACSQVCYCIPGRWVPGTKEVPFNSNGIFWIKNAQGCSIQPYSPKLEDFKMMDMSQDPPVEVKLSMKEPQTGVYLLTPEGGFEKDKQYKVEFLPDLCKDSPQKPPAGQELKPLEFKAVEEGSFPAGQEIKLTQKSCGYNADSMCTAAGVQLTYEASLPNALKIWTDMWHVSMLVDGQEVAASKVYGVLKAGVNFLCEKPKKGGDVPLVGDVVVQMKLTLPGWGRTYFSEQILVSLKCEKSNTCVEKQRVKAGAEPPKAGCGCQAQPTGPIGWPLGLMLLAWVLITRRRQPTQ